MADPPAPDPAPLQEPGEEADADPRNPLTADLNDLIVVHQHHWLWSEIAVDLQDLATLSDHADTCLGALHTPIPPEWALQAAQGIARSSSAIHQHAERHGSYAAAARSLWTCAIPRAEPTLTDAQIYALLAKVEARSSAEAFCEIAIGLEDELQRHGIGHEELEEITWVRGDIAGWERLSWRWADLTKAAAERFLLMASVARSAPAIPHPAEQQIIAMRQRLQQAEVLAGRFRGGRQPGAYAPLTRALLSMVQAARSRELDVVLAQIEDCLAEDIEGVRFDEITATELQYTDLTRNKVTQIQLDSLRRKLARLPDN